MQLLLNALQRHSRHILILVAAALMFVSVSARAQTGTITGTVVEANTDDALAGVNVGLAGTTLGAATNEDGRFTISETTQLEVELSQQAVELSGITVTGRRGGYVAESITSANKIGAPLTETPQSVSVITHDQLAVKGVTRLSEALRYTPGVQGETFGFEPQTTFLRFRGFDATTTGLYRNGLQLRNPSFAVGYSLAA